MAHKLNAQEPENEETIYYGSAGFGVLELFNLGFGFSFQRQPALKLTRV
jgi:hypothetical protein